MSGGGDPCDPLYIAADLCFQTDRLDLLQVFVISGVAALVPLALYISCSHLNVFELTVM